MNEFDQWRERYDSMTTEEQVKYHNDLEERYPEQNHFNYLYVCEALKIAQKPTSVLEFGTWKGDLALKAFQNHQIETWIGIEICEAAIKKTKCDKILYIKPKAFDWFYQERNLHPDIIIATHFIEHLSNEHFEQLVRFCKGIKIIHFESPLTDQGNEWDGYLGTHKLTIGWNRVNEIMKENGYTLKINQPESKTYEYNLHTA